MFYRTLSLGGCLLQASGQEMTPIDSKIYPALTVTDLGYKFINIFFCFLDLHQCHISSITMGG